jgi:phospholipase/lecithinase/hemolysin
MTLVASGRLNLYTNADGNNRSITYEVAGSLVSKPITLSGMFNASNPSVSVAMSNFYGHTQGTTYGDLYCTNNYSATAYISFGGVEYSSPTSDNVTKKVENAASSPVSCYYAEGASGQPFSSGVVTCQLQRRTKNTSGGWTDITPSGWDTDYTSQSYSCAFDTYDYLFTLTSQ